VADSIINPPSDTLINVSRKTTSEFVAAAKMCTTQPVSGGSANQISADANPGVNTPTKSISVQQQGELPDVASLQMIINDPVTACHGAPIQQPPIEAKQEGAQDRRGEDTATSLVKEKDGRNEDANSAASTARYRPAYELADAAHERLGRGTQPPVLTAK
jgi:hypothetical protein